MSNFMLISTNEKDDMLILFNNRIREFRSTKYPRDISSNNLACVPNKSKI